MSEEVGKALQSVVERLNQAAARRSKVTARGGAEPGRSAAAGVKVSWRGGRKKSHEPPPSPGYVRPNRTLQPLG